MNKGIIIEVRDDCSIVLSDGAYVRVRNKKNMTEGTQIVFTEEDTLVSQKTRNTTPLPMMRYASVAAIFVVAILLSVVFYSQNIAVFAVVTLDINPSVEVQLNRQNKVIGIEAMNEDGESLLDVDVKGLSIDEAIGLLVAEAEMDGFIKDDEDAFIAVTTVAKKGDEAQVVEEIQGLIDSALDKEEYLDEVTVILLEASDEELEEAKSDGKPLSLVALQNEGKAKGKESVKELAEDEEQLQEMEEAGYVHRNTVGKSVENRNDVQVLVDKVEALVDGAELTEEQVELYEAYLSAYEAYAESSEDADVKTLLKELKAAGNAVVKALTPDEEQIEEQVGLEDDDSEDESDTPEDEDAYDEGFLVALQLKLEAAHRVMGDISVSVDDEDYDAEDVEALIEEIIDAIDGLKENNNGTDKELQVRAKNVVKALQKAGVKMSVDEEGSIDISSEAVSDETEVDDDDESSGQPEDTGKPDKEDKSNNGNGGNSSNAGGNGNKK